MATSIAGDPELEILKNVFARQEQTINAKYEKCATTYTPPVIVLTNMPSIHIITSMNIAVQTQAVEARILKKFKLDQGNVPIMSVGQVKSLWAQIISACGKHDYYEDITNLADLMDDIFSLDYRGSPLV